jgi:hypothetical protein
MSSIGNEPKGSADIGFAIGASPNTNSGGQDPRRLDAPTQVALQHPALAVAMGHPSAAARYTESDSPLARRLAHGED